MPTVIRNTPACLIPKELYKEEKIQEYWNVLFVTPHHETVVKDDLGEFFLLYQNKELDTVHEISLMYQYLQEKFPEHNHAICINVYDEGFNLLVVKNCKIAYTSYFHFSVNEDILYHLANVSQQFFENISQITFFYQQLTPPVLRLLNNYYEMKKLSHHD
jgi:hypothetical protein